LPAAALPCDQRAIELHPNFVMGYRAVDNDYLGLGETSRAGSSLVLAIDRQKVLKQVHAASQK